MFKGVARRVVGVTNDSEKYKILEDSFGMFLTKNLKDQYYNIKVVGITHPLYMEFYFDLHNDNALEKSNSNDSYTSGSSLDDEHYSNEKERKENVEGGVVEVGDDNDEYEENEKKWEDEIENDYESALEDDDIDNDTTTTNNNCSNNDNDNKLGKRWPRWKGEFCTSCTNYKK